MVDEEQSGSAGAGEKQPSSRILRAWIPLAASWLLMATEMPVISAVLARMSDAETQLGAYGGVALPIALVIESPIIMLLAASAELCRDEKSYRSLRSFTHRTGAILTLLHLLIAMTPLFDWVVVGVLDVAEPVVEPARLGFLWLTPWTWAIASRRFQQGILVRYGCSRAVTEGTVIRLLSGASVLFLGFGTFYDSGVVLAGMAMSVSVLAEAAYVAWRVRPLIVKHLSGTVSDLAPLRGASFLQFYLPLALTPMITLLARPLCTGGISRMPQELESLAVWPVMGSVTFLLGAVGLSFTEVVVTHFGSPGSRQALRRITWGGTALVGTVALLFVTTPLGPWWLAELSGLSPNLSALALAGLTFGVFGPFQMVLQSWFQGVLVYSRKTAPITESVVVFLTVCTGGLVAGIILNSWSGAVVAMTAVAIGRTAQSFWLWFRTRGIEELQALR